MRISVIIITRNRKDDVKQTIEGYLSQTYSDKEIVVIDNESRDGTREMMEVDYPDIKYLWLPDNFDIRSINLGVELSTGDIIWRTDSDSHPESPDTFERVAGIFKNHPDIDIVCSENIEVKKAYTVWEWYPFQVDKTKEPPDGFPANIFAGTGAGIRRNVFDKIGGFWEFGFEELDFCTRAILAGCKVRYFPSVRTLHFSSPFDRNNNNRWIQILKQNVRYSWRYFPFFQAIGRVIQFYSTHLFFGVLKGVSIGAVFESFFTVLAVSFSTFRNERKVVTTAQLKEITMGVSVFRTQVNYFREIIKRNIKKWRNH
ncbi:MAG: hypothetical protein HW421_1240 [Ignavibacteria bacterium]|nr:hypothetical protein [Ignavibacteria bacterium]